MIKAKKNKKSDSVKVDMKGNCSMIADEYTAVTQAFANMCIKACIKACIPGTIELIKKDIHKNLDIAFEVAETTKGEAWSNS